MYSPVYYIILDRETLITISEVRVEVTEKNQAEPKHMQGYYVDFSRTFTAGYGMPGFEATEKQKKHYKLALES